MIEDLQVKFQFYSSHIVIKAYFFIKKNKNYINIEISW